MKLLAGLILSMQVTSVLEMLLGQACQQSYDVLVMVVASSAKPNNPSGLEVWMEIVKLAILGRHVPAVPSHPRSLLLFSAVVICDYATR